MSTVDSSLLFSQCLSSEVLTHVLLHSEVLTHVFLHSEILSQVLLHSEVLTHVLLHSEVFYHMFSCRLRFSYMSSCPPHSLVFSLIWVDFLCFFLSLTILRITVKCFVEGPSGKFIWCVYHQARIMCPGKVKCRAHSCYQRVSHKDLSLPMLL